MEWPIAPRADARARIEAGLARRPFPAVLITGPTGIGKTTLARSIIEDRESSLEVIALAELSDVPLGALAPALASGVRGSDLSERLANAVGAIVASGPSVILVDDAPLLDELSAAAVYQLVRVYKLPVILTARDEHPLVGAIQRLDHEGLVQRVDLGPLSSVEVESVLERRLGAIVEPESVRALMERSGGNPLVLRTLALAAEEQRTIHPGEHGLVVDEPALPRHVGAIVSARVSGLTPRRRALALQLALCQPVPRSLAGDLFDELLSVGAAVMIGSAGDERLTISHPLVAQVLIEESLPGDRRQAARDAAQLLSGSDDEQLRFRTVVLRLRHGVRPDASELVWAASYAHTVQDHALAARLAEFASESGARYDTELVRGSALSALGDGRAEDVLRSALTLAQTDADVALALVRLGHHLAIRDNRPGDAVAAAAERLNGLEDEAARALLGADLMKWQSMAGMALPAAPAVSGTGGPGDLAALIGAAMVGSMVGDLDATMLAVGSARPLVETYRAAFPNAGDLLDLNEFLGLVLDGRIREAEDYARVRHERPRSDATGLWSYTLALIALHTGRATEALVLANEAVTELAWRDFTGLQGAAIALRATAESQLGGRTLAHGELGPAHLQDIKVRLQLAESDAWQLALAGDLDEAAEIVRSAALEGVAAGHLTLASLTAATASRFGRGSAVAELLTSAAARSRSRLVDALAGAARAQASADEPALASAADDLATVGLTAPAAELWELAARRSPSQERARSLRRAAETCRGELELVSLIAIDNRVGDLTERELSIAKAAAARRRSHEIAADLGLSVRTVDNHLSRIYRKLGVQNRLQLEEALGDGPDEPTGE